MKHLIALVLLVFSFSAHAQVLFVSDVDDTIKLANVQDLADSAQYAFDDKTRFMGMSELYNTIASERSDLYMVYLSKAPEWFMAKTHRSFLKNGKFPQGFYIGRTNLAADVHKLENIRKLMNVVKPKKVIFIGDNGEQDPTVYGQIAKEYANQGIEFHQFIRIVYSKSLFIDWGTELAPSQIGFVSPFEIAVELEKANLISATSVQNLINKVGPQFVKVPLIFNVDGYNIAFPDFVNCSDYVWRWDGSLNQYKGLSSIKKRITNRCAIPFF